MENETPKNTLLKKTSRQRLKKTAKDNRKKVSIQMKTLKRPLKVGEFLQYNRQQEGALAFIHKFLHEVHGDVYDEFLKKEQEDQKVQPTEEEITQAETQEAVEEIK